MPERFKQILLELVRKLDLLSESFEVIGDSEVRQKMSDFIADFFLHERTPLPQSFDFATGSAIAESALLNALSTYVVQAGQLSAEQGLNLRGRLAVFQDVAVTTDRGSTYDEYFGYWEPEAFQSR